VKSTPFSGEPDVIGGIGPETRQLLQISVEDIYGRFIGMVAAARKLPVPEVNRIGQGRVWSGTEAQRLKLVDGLGGLDVAVAAAARRAKLQGTPRTIDIETRRSPLLEFLSEISGPMEAAPQQRAAGRDPFAKLSLASRSQLFAMISDVKRMASGPTMQSTCLQCAAMGSPRLATAARLEAEMKALLAR
jgi:protease-4